MTVLSFGEILWDIYPDKKYIGGASFNFAAHMAKHGRKVYLLSCLGQDSLGAEALACLKEYGILSDYVSRSAAKQTGCCLVKLDGNGVPSYDLKQDVAYDYIDCDRVAGEFDVLYFGTLALRGSSNITALETLLNRQAFREIFVDVNIRMPFCSRESLSFSAKHATILKVSLEELPTVADFLSIDETADYKRFSALLKETYPNVKVIIITLGSDGAYCLDCRHDAAYSCTSQKVAVASTVGAGDSFSAAFLHQYLANKDLPFCLNYASKVAGFVVSKTDAVPQYQVADFL